MGVAEVDEAEGAMGGGVVAEPAGEIGGAGGGRGAPEGADVALVGGEKDVLGGAGGGGDFLPFGDFAVGLHAGEQGEDQGGVARGGVEFGAFGGVVARGGRDRVVDGAECFGEESAGGGGGENVEAPGLGEAVGGSPAGVFEQVGDDFAGDGPRGVHGERLEGTAGAEE